MQNDSQVDRLGVRELCCDGSLVDRLRIDGSRDDTPYGDTLRANKRHQI